MKQVMIDLETLRQKNDPLVFSAAAVEFGPSGKIYKSKVWYIDVQDSIKHGFKISKDTLIWWLQWPDLLKSQIDREDAISVIPFLYDFAHWIETVKKDDELIIWGDSAFDQNIIESMYDKFDFDCPIEFRKYRDVRTIKALAEEFNFGINIIKKQVHDPLQDAIYNIQYVTRFYKEMKGRLNGKTD